MSDDAAQHFRQDLVLPSLRLQKMPTTRTVKHLSFDTSVAANGPQLVASALLSWTVGVVFGRFDIRFADGGTLRPCRRSGSMYEPLPVCALLACSRIGTVFPSEANLASRLPNRLAPVMAYWLTTAGASRLTLASVSEGGAFERDLRRCRSAFWEESARDLGLVQREDFREAGLRMSSSILHIKQYSDESPAGADLLAARYTLGVVLHLALLSPA